MPLPALWTHLPATHLFVYTVTVRYLLVPSCFHLPPALCRQLLALYLPHPVPPHLVHTFIPYLLPSHIYLGPCCPPPKVGGPPGAVPRLCHRCSTCTHTHLRDFHLPLPHCLHYATTTNLLPLAAPLFGLRCLGWTWRWWVGVNRFGGWRQTGEHDAAWRGARAAMAREMTYGGRGRTYRQCQQDVLSDPQLPVNGSGRWCMRGQTGGAGPTHQASAAGPHPRACAMTPLCLKRYPHTGVAWRGNQPTTYPTSCARALQAPNLPHPHRGFLGCTRGRTFADMVVAHWDAAHRHSFIPVRYLLPAHSTAHAAHAPHCLAA